MTLQQLRYFRCVVRTGSIRKAATTLYVTEPTLSQQLKVLERELGSPLFERVHGHLELTELGRRIQASCEAMLAHEAAIRRHAEELKGHEVLRVGAIPAVIRLLLADALTLFQSRWPGAHITLREEGTLAILEALGAGALDFGIVATSDAFPLPQHHQRQVLLESQLVLCEPASAPRHAQGLLPLITLPKDYLLHDLLIDYAARRGNRVVIHSASAESALRFVASGLGIAVLPEYMTTREKPDGVRVSELRWGRELPTLWRWELVWPTDRRLLRLDRAWIDSMIAASSRVSDDLGFLAARTDPIDAEPPEFDEPPARDQDGSQPCPKPNSAWWGADTLS
jgi:DNA-binding transcriptional LysR family regulator